ncbi:sporulation histidine kinase inhibitor Sda [Cohnella yongneupensis]|uniref:Sporulation histidine kinase inhibitor Sda n=1 Tax=Cohnella yongneupensis TaxID=425006 RepID=A0ABW0R131_9BACL
MNQRSYPYVVSSHIEPNTHFRQPGHVPTDTIAARRLSDKASLLRPLRDEHLLEVYREAKKMNLSLEFIELLEEAISIRQLDYQEA